MKKTTKIILVLGIAVLLLIAGILQWNWFHVDGSELAFLDHIPADCTATVNVTLWNGSQQELDISSAQIQQFLDLLRNSAYRRETAPSVTGNWDKTYFVLLNYTLDGQPHFLFLQICGDEAVHFSGSFDVPFPLLLIESDNWQEAMDAIFPIS